jgi:signal peptidase I
VKRSPTKYRIWIYLFVSAGFVVAALLAYVFLYSYPYWTLRPFKIPSKSMCPTICNGERIFVRMQNGAGYVPREGDVIIFEYGPDRAKFIKRVIGIPGDTVAPGPNNTILVNGEPWHPPPVCAKSLLTQETSLDMTPYSHFKETHVSENQLFVIGDNLPNSFDSRVDRFEPVTTDKVIGRPVLIYWSTDSSRIGSPIH